jgi:hypothetical protein
VSVGDTKSPGEPETPLLCDDCGGRASSVHILPTGATPRDVRLACHHHDPGGESWLLTEEAELDQLWDRDALLDRLRPGLTDGLPFTALDPEWFWDRPSEQLVAEPQRGLHPAGTKSSQAPAGYTRVAATRPIARKTPSVRRPRQIGAVGKHRDNRRVALREVSFRG